MARGRMLSKSLSTSQRYARLIDVAGSLAEFCQSLYPLINSHADDFGRLAGDPFTVKHACHPTSPRRLQQFEMALQHLDEVGLIRWYEVDGQWVIQIQKFDEHQKGLALAKRTKSKFPACPEGKHDVPAVSMKAQEITPELKGTELNRTEESVYAAESAASPAVLTFPTREGDWGLTSAHLERLKETYSDVDVMAQCRRAREWCLTNPAKRKTVKGMPAFLANWLADGRSSNSRAREPARTHVPSAAASREFQQRFREAK